MINQGMFSTESTVKGSIVANGEVGVSVQLMRAGYNIRGLLTPYQSDFLTKANWEINIGRSKGDPWSDGNYFDQNINPLDSVFFKTNRGVMTAFINRLSESI